MVLIARYFNLEQPDVAVAYGLSDDEAVEEILKATNMTKRHVLLADSW